MADQDDRILDANPRGCQLLGYTRDELLTMRITDLQAPEVRGQTGSVIRTELARSQGTPFEALDLHRDGTRIPVEVTTSPLTGGLVPAIVRDISERKRAEEALRESETRLRALAESAQDGIVMMDPAGHISFWNPAAAALCGYTAEEALGQHLHTLLAPEPYYAAYAAAFPRFQETGCGAAVGQTLELAARCKDGRILPVELSLSAMALSDGWHAVGIMRKITARKQAEEAVRESEEKFRALAENSLDVIMRFDRAHRHLYVNAAAAATTGIPAADFIGKTHEELGFPAHLVELWAAAIDTVFTSGASHRIEFQLSN
ncbi:MAG TPA: PAS domain S-box protein [Anaerolineae bacterium]|nr:PAS domain S-box protein [Anaerolineae bacterium]